MQNFEFDFLISNLPRMTKLCIGVFEKKRTGPQALFWYYFNFSILDCDYRAWAFVVHFSGQSYKASTIVIYDSRVVRDWKIPHITTLES